MGMPTRRRAILALFILLMLFTLDAQAAIGNQDILDNVMNRYSAAASAWAAIITARASWLFWTLATISMVWTFGMLALRKADMGEFFAEFIRFIVFTGFFWWLLVNGPKFAMDIMDSLGTLGGIAGGVGKLTPSGIVDIGFDIFFRVLDQSSIWSPVDSTVGIIISAVILVVMAQIGVQMLLLLISGWILAYAGVFFLGFGGSRWTSDMAINYYRSVLSLAAQLFAMVLIVGIGKSFVDQYYADMSGNIQLKELGVMLIVAIVLYAIVHHVPSMIGQLAMGGGAHAPGMGVGSGMVAGALGMAGAAVSTAASMVGGAAAGVAGTHSAVKAAQESAQKYIAEGVEKNTGLGGALGNNPVSRGIATSGELLAGGWKATGDSIAKRGEETFAGKVAEAIRKSGKPTEDQDKQGAGKQAGPEFTGDSLGAGSEEEA